MIGIVGATWRLLIWPVRDFAGSTLGDVGKRVEARAVEASGAPAVEFAVDGILAGPLPETVGRAIGEHRVVERVVAEAVANTDVEATVASVLESERTRQLVDQVLASPALERMLSDALESRLTADLTERFVRSPEFEAMLRQVVASPAVRRAVAEQSTSVLGEAAAGARRRAVRVDDRAERRPRRWLRRPARAAEAPLAVPYAGVATRGIALAVDAALVALVFIVGGALVGLVSSLVGDLRPAWVVGAIMGGAWLLLEILYFAGFWTASGQTPGMRAMRLRVVTRAGEPPGFGRSVVRLFGLALSIIPCFAGFLPALVDDRRRALHDFIAGTVVIYDEHVLASVAGAAGEPAAPRVPDAAARP